jgi:glycosyltransferase involved in cell wall biosynthesis
MISIIIPAHNEESVISRAISELLKGAQKGILEVIVVCNGCSDNTAGVVASFGPAIRCIETAIPSKSNALNIGDAAARGFPRIYQDADVVLSMEAVQRIAYLLQSDQFLAAAPKMQMAFGGASWPVRAYYAIWEQLPYVREGMIGVGVYALSRNGRKRFDSFPDIIADDGYIRALFKSHERKTLNTCSSLVHAPSDLQGLIKIKTRSRLGEYELREKFPELLQNVEKYYGNAMLYFLGKISLWPMTSVYLIVNILARIRAKRYTLKYGYTGWERDNSSRKNSSLNSY